MNTASMSLTVAAFYKFSTIEDCPLLQAELRGLCERLDILGTVLIAEEGINGTVAGTPEAIETLIGRLRGDPRFAKLDVKISHASVPPFGKLKIKIKPEIVTFGVPGVRPDLATGIEVEGRQWNELLASDDVIVIDTRNSYEVAIGSFPGAIDPGTRNFQEFVRFVETDLSDAKDKRIAMFCTGGIRCEKASSYLLSLGFRDVYQLKGGILRYLEDVPEAESRWQGGCFVFDGRVALEHGVREGPVPRCVRCGQPFRQDGPVCDAAEGLCPDCSG